MELFLQIIGSVVLGFALALFNEIFFKNLYRKYKRWVSS